MGTFGTNTNPAHYVEVVDPLVPGQVKRPAAGVVLKARSYPDGTALSSITVGDYGYWSATFDVDAITVSGDDGATWVGPLFSSEGMAGAVTTQTDVSVALSQASQAFEFSQQAAQLAGNAAPVGHTHPASAITFIPRNGISATDLQGAVEQAALLGGGGGGGGATSTVDVLYSGGSYPAQAASAPAGVKVRHFYGPFQYLGPTWAGVLDLYTYAELT